MFDKQKTKNDQSLMSILLNTLNLILLNLYSIKPHINKKYVVIYAIDE